MTMTRQGRYQKDKTDESLNSFIQRKDILATAGFIKEIPPFPYRTKNKAAKVIYRKLFKPLLPSERMVESDSYGIAMLAEYITNWISLSNHIIDVQMSLEKGNAREELALELSRFLKCRKDVYGDMRHIMSSFGLTLKDRSLMLSFLHPPKDKREKIKEIHEFGEHPDNNISWN